VVKVKGYDGKDFIATVKESYQLDNERLGGAQLQHGKT
jgi:hypothetical protein